MGQRTKRLAPSPDRHRAPSGSDNSEGEECDDRTDPADDAVMCVVNVNLRGPGPGDRVTHALQAR